MKSGKQITFAATLALVAGVAALPKTATSQPRPLPLRLTAESNRGVGSVIDVERLSADESRFYWEGTTVDPAGYLRIVTPPGYLGLVAGLSRRASPIIDANGLAGKYLLGAISPRSELKESGRRTNLIFDTPSGPGMLTIWEFGADGAQVHRLRPFLNVQVGANRGTLSLALPDGSHSALWKLTWIADANNVQFELYIPDQLDAGKQPMLSPEGIVEFGRAIQLPR